MSRLIHVGTGPTGPVPAIEARPAGPTRGGVVVLHDIFGLSSYIGDVADTLAAAGWHAVCPALFHRTGAAAVPLDRIEEGFAGSAALTGPGLLDDVDAALAALHSEGTPAGQVALLGFCMGGTIASFAATERPLGAVVSLYGGVGPTQWPGVPPLLESYPRLSVPWLGIFGTEDDMIPSEDVDLIEQKLGQVSRYPGGHAFHRHTTPDYYHPESARTAWAEVMAFLEEKVPQAQRAVHL